MHMCGMCDELWQKRSPRPRGRRKCARERVEMRKSRHMGRMHNFSGHRCAEKNELCENLSALSVRIRALCLCAFEMPPAEKRRINNSGRARCTKFAHQAPTAVGLIMMNKQTCKHSALWLTLSVLKWQASRLDTWICMRANFHQTLMVGWAGGGLLGVYFWLCVDVGLVPGGKIRQVCVIHPLFVRRHTTWWRRLAH